MGTYGVQWAGVDMTTLKIAQFSGELPKLVPRMLPDQFSQYSENVRLDDGALTPIRKARLEYTFTSPSSGIKTIYKFGSTWLAWTSVVNAVLGPVDTERLYYTGDGAPKMRSGSDIYALAVPAPTVALSGAVSGVGVGDVITRLYVYTFVTSFGEESEPCPVSADVNWQQGQTVTLTGFQSAPTGRAITTQRIYRSQSSSQSGTDLFLIAERAVSASSFTDNIAPENFAEVLPSRDWNPPPSDLAGLVSMPNGILVGFSGNQICFSEPFRPHAWPEKYRLTTPYKIVGLGCFGTTVVAGTAGYPVVVSGTHPDSMVEEKIEVNLPCINARGVVDLGYSVAYPSNDGLVVVSSGGAQLVTDKLYTRPDWQKLLPSQIIGGQFTGRYFMSYQYTEADGSVQSGVQVIDLSGDQPFVLRAGQKADAYFYDISTGKLFVLYGQSVYEWDAYGQEPETMEWKSKVFVLPMPVSFGAILIEGSSDLSIEEETAIQEANNAIILLNEAKITSGTLGELNSSPVNSYALSGDSLGFLKFSKQSSVYVYADGNLVCAVSDFFEPKRIPYTKRAKTWEFVVVGNAAIEQITLASTIRELNQT